MLADPAVAEEGRSSLDLLVEASGTRGCVIVVVSECIWNALIVLLGFSMYMWME